MAQQIAAINMSPLRGGSSGRTARYKHVTPTGCVDIVGSLAINMSPLRGASSGRTVRYKHVTPTRCVSIVGRWL